MGSPLGVGLDRGFGRDVDRDPDALDVLGIDPDVADAADRNAAITHRARHREPADRALEIDDEARGCLLELDAGEPDDEGERGADQPENEGADQDVARAGFHGSDQPPEAARDRGPWK